MGETLGVLLFASVAAVIGLLAGFVGCQWALRNAGPVATADALADLGRVRLEWASWKTGADSLLESMQDVEEVIERKRRRVAARESFEAKREANGSKDPAADLRARARAMGHPV